ncbi:MAG TPA: aminopeptidase [Desulfobacterales bacterium]
MFTDRQLQRYADVLLWALETARTGKIHKNDVVALRYHRPALPLAEILYARLIQMGVHPVQRQLETPGMEKSFYSLSNDRQLKFVPPGEETLYRDLNGSILLYAPESMTHLSDVDPARIGKTTVARKFLRSILDRREERGLFSWTLCLVPTEALAGHAGMSSEAYARQVVKACFLNRRSPVEAWRQVYSDIQAIKRRLNRLKIDTLQVESEHIDLKIRVGERRRWLGLSGHNIPSFEVFISPDWRGTDGVFYADQPSFRSGNLVEKVRLEFQNGLLIDAQAEIGDSFLRQQLSMDPGAGRIGEFSLTDRRFSRIDAFMANTLYDENYGGRYGNCHVAMGSSYSESFAGKSRDLAEPLKQNLGFNDSALHWDLVNTQNKRVTAILSSGKSRLIYEDGQFQI